MNRFSRYLGDILFIMVVALLAFFLAEKPETIKGVFPRPAREVSGTPPPPEVKSIDAGKNHDGKAIHQRNIFVSLDGSRDPAHGPVGDRSYLLIGIVRENDGMMAFFRSETGIVIKAAAGRTMDDGFRVAAVQDSQVLLERGKEKKILKVYEAYLDSLPGKNERKNGADLPPALTAILGGEDKRAVFKDQAGHVTILRAGQSLPDGSVIVRVDSRFVTVRKGQDEKELMLYAKVISPPPTGATHSLSGETSPPSAAGTRRRGPSRKRPDTRGQPGGT
jgi:hypothetical protein